jgi:hypothetical protein
MNASRFMLMFTPKLRGSGFDGTAATPLPIPHFDRPGTALFKLI